MTCSYCDETRTVGSIQIRVGETPVGKLGTGADTARIDIIRLCEEHERTTRRMLAQGRKR
jgi:hypothetical protein